MSTEHGQTRTHTDLHGQTRTRRRGVAEKKTPGTETGRYQDEEAEQISAVQPTEYRLR